MSTPVKFERLPKHVKPILYDLSLKVDLKNFTFSGKETITVKIERAVDEIILNSKELSITNSMLITDIPEDSTKIPEILLCEEDETLTLHFPNLLPVGQATILIEFNGKLSTNTVGFYRSKYINIAGEDENYCAVTQFAACNARQCFPCWDEPAIKARFDITLEVDSTKTALSNMPVEKEIQINNDIKRVKFARTPIMSTYLVAFIVGDFEYVEDHSSDGVLVRVYVPVGKKNQGQFALYVATKVLPYYKEYFQIAYPLPKIDLVAVAEMSYGAMENWGLITYRESCLLVDESNTSAATKQEVVRIVGHELAHQWFGNLVSMEWWTHLWLNEGYASFFENLGVDHIFPEYNIWTQFVSERYHLALELDALQNSHPIEVPVGHPSEISEIFDNISYNKGASVIRMLYNFIGEQNFKKGMNLYLTRHQYGNTLTEDLWTAFEEVSNTPIRAIMSTWTKQVGFPLVTVEEGIQYDDSRTLILSQSNFCYKDTDEYVSWFIPLTFCTQSNPNVECFTTMNVTQRGQINIPNVKADDWIKLNPGAIGFYRTQYPWAMLQQFLPSIRDGSMPPADRFAILDDFFALVRIGEESTVQFLKLIREMKEEDNYIVWKNILICLEKIHNLLMDTECLLPFELYAIEIIKPIYHKLGLENDTNESHFTTLLRNLVLISMVRFGATDFSDIMREKFRKHCSTTDVIRVEQRSFVYRTVLASDGKKAFDDLVKLYRQSDMEEEKNRILKAFAAIVDNDLVDDALQFAMSDDLNPPSTAIALTSIASSKVARLKTFQLVKEFYDDFQEMYSGGSLFPRLLKSTTENFASKESANEIETFFASKSTSGVKRTIQQSLESIRNNAAWLRRDYKHIKNYLTANSMDCTFN